MTSTKYIGLDVHKESISIAVMNSIGQVVTQPTGCKEICDVQPDAWKDFYLGRGRSDAAKYGDRYAFCTDAALLK